MSRTVWLASYPKSGNTWFRLVMDALLEDASFAQCCGVRQESIASDRKLFDRYLGIPSALLNEAEIQVLRPAVNQLVNEHTGAPSGKSVLLRKIHDAYSRLENGAPLFGESSEFSAIYILRDPWDVAVSMAHYSSCDYDEAVSKLLDPEYTIASGGAGQAPQLPQRLLSWEAHVISWVQAPLDVHVVRYEDMHRSPMEAFARALSWLGINCDEQSLYRAVEHCSFDNLQQREQEQGFAGKPVKAERFFRRGMVGEGLDVLRSDQIDLLSAAKERVEAAIQQRECS